jgi:hypothetical protein
MSHELSGRRKFVTSNNPIATLVFSLGHFARLPHGRMLSRLLLSLGLFGIAAASVLAQKAQAVKSTQPITCEGQKYELRLLTAEAPINDKNAKVLGIVLTPEGATDSKVFALYWLDANSKSPTNRDNTDATLGNTLYSYVNGLTKDKVPVVASFFRELRCSSDSQAINIQDQLNSIRQAPALRDVIQGLKNRGVSVDDAQVADASDQELAPFKGLTSDIEFAKAIRQYVSGLLVHKPSLEDENKRLKSQNTELEEKLQELRTKIASPAGRSRIWLIIPLVITVILLLLSLAYIVITYPIDNKTKLKTDGDSGRTPDTDVAKEQIAKVSAKLGEIINSANVRVDGFAGIGTEATQPGDRRNQKAKSQSLADIVLQRLKGNHIVRSENSGLGRRLLEEALGESAVAQWFAAYVDLKNQLEEFKNSLSTAGAPSESEPKAVASSPAEVPTVVQETTLEHKLATDISALKSSVDSFDAKLVGYVESNRGLQNIWWQWYRQDYSGGPTEDLVAELREVIDLYRFLSERCCRDGKSAASTKRNLEDALSDLDLIRQTYLASRLDDRALVHEITDKIRTKLANDVDAVERYEAIEKSLRNLFSTVVKADEAVPRLIKERSDACDKLKPYYPYQNFAQTIDAIVADYEAMVGEINRALPRAQGTPSEMVTSLASEYLTLKPDAEKAQRLEIERDDLQQQLVTARSQQKAGKDLVQEILFQLNFNPLIEDEQSITSTLSKLIKERESSVYLQLRLGLSAALAALQKATNSNGSAEQLEVIEALHLEKVKKGIKEVLADMEKCSGEQLWTIALAEGFSEKWLHYLIRADLLLRTYYSHQREFGFLQQTVSLACSALLAALYELQVEVVEVGLFEPLPQEMETEPVYPGIRNLPAVREKVRLKLEGIQTGDVVVDVTSFPFFVKGIQENRGRASLANPSAWLQY